MKNLYNQYYTIINDDDYNALLEDYDDGFIMLLEDDSLDGLLTYFDDVSPRAIKDAIYNTMLSFYQYNDSFIATLSQ